MPYSGTAFRSAGSAGADLDLPHVADLLHQVHETVRRIPSEETGTSDDVQRALDILSRQVERSLRTLRDHPGRPLTRSEKLSFEAVIRTDGTRPSLLVRNNEIDLEHPLARAWKPTLLDRLNLLRRLVPAVGRIEPRTPSTDRYFGTGWMIDSAKGLVITNLHVLEALYRRLPHAFIPASNGSFRIIGGNVFIDFAAESGVTRSDRFRVVRAVASGAIGLDAAVLGIEPTRDDQNIPASIDTSADVHGPWSFVASVCTIGFPAPPRYRDGIEEGVDWQWVNATLFGNCFGVKRLALGEIHRPVGTFPSDPRGWIFGHDSTTLGGSSGSPVLAWENGGAAIGLHFGGDSLDTNRAHRMGSFRDELVAMGVSTRLV